MQTDTYESQEPSTTTFSGLEIEPLPQWVQEIYGNQIQAVWEVLDAFDEVDVVFLDAPTGAGKTLIAELIARELRLQALYICSDKSLQNQFARDFNYAKVLKGRSNYPVQSGDDRFTAADCTAQKRTDPCWHCPDGKAGCPYELAKAEALGARIAVTNTAYLLSEANYVGNFSDRELVIVDEADTLESMLMGFVEYRVPQRTMDLVKMEAPKKSVRKTTLIVWLNEFADALDGPYKLERDIKKKQALRATLLGARRMAKELQVDIDARAADDEATGMWLREYPPENTNSRYAPSDGLILKPVMVSAYGYKNLWQHGHKWLVMSATIISADEMADSLGLEAPYRVVSMDSTFPVESRPIIMAPVANMVYKEMDERQGGTAVEDLVYAIGVAARRHPGERMLVHCVSYSLAKRITEALKGVSYQGVYKVPNRKVLTYTQGRDRDTTLSQYIDTAGAIMVSPSMERGIDLPDDLCRVQIIAKCPFPALKGTISARTHMPGGNVWYSVQTIRDFVQMCGRGMRHKDDWCVTYVFDKQFASNLWGKSRQLFPRWFSEAVDTRFDIREFVRPK